MKRISLLAVVLAVGLSAGSARVTAVEAETAAEKGRRVLAQHQDAVLNVRAVLKITMTAGGQAQNREQKMETNGTVIDPSGLIVVSYTMLDPSESIKAGAPKGNLEVETEITDLQIVLPDQTEIAGQVVLRDADLDLAFIRPAEKPAKPLAAVDLAQNATPKVLDPMVVLSRFDKGGNRTPAVFLGEVNAVLNKPRTCYVVGQVPSLGVPVFNLDGKVAGVVVVRRAKTALETTSTLPVILPAVDIQEAAKSAPATAKPPTTKPAE